jgi:ABC-type glycerol-3-phosphate transport system permease component
MSTVLHQKRLIRFGGSMYTSRYRLALWLKYALTYVILIALSILMAFPLFWMVLTSLKNRREVFTTFWPRTIDWSNYGRVWDQMDLPVHFQNSLYVTGLNVAIVVVTATLAGYAFAKLKFPLRDWIFYIFLAAMMIPGQAILIPMFIFLKRIGLLNTRMGLSLSMTGGAIAFAIFIMRAFFRSLPSELGDAGKIDGCTEWGVFWRIFLPLSRPGIATIVIFQFMGTWNEFMFSSTFIYKPELKTMQPALYQAVGRYGIDYTALSTGLVMAIIPILIVFFALQRYFIRGLTAGAFKG